MTTETTPKSPEELKEEKRLAKKVANRIQYQANRGDILAYGREWNAKNPERLEQYKAKGLSEVSKEKGRQRELKRYYDLRKNKPWSIAVDDARARARHAGIECDLTKEWAKQRWTGRCEISGIEFRTNCGRSVYSLSIDKIDPKLGYIQTNCRFVILGVNLLKFTGTDKDMYAIAKAIVEKIRRY